MSKPIITILELIERRAQEHTEKDAFIFIKDTESAPQKLSYGDLANKCKSLAAHLQEKIIIQQQTSAILLLQPGLDYVVSFWGCILAGLIPIPVYPPNNKNISRLKHIISNSNCKIILSNNNNKPYFSTIFSEVEIKERLDSKEFHWISIEEAKPHELYNPPLMSGDTIAFIQYTSGSTSSPKGVLVSHSNLLFNAELANKYFQFNPDCSMVSWLPPYHDMGLIGGIFQPIYSAMTAVLMSPITFLKRPLTWLIAISTCKVKNNGFVVSGAPNFAYDYCLSKIKKEELTTINLCNWKIAYSGAEPVQASTIEVFSSYFEECNFNKKAFYPVYGLAEATLLVSAGIPFEGPTIKSFNSEKMNLGYISEISETDNVASQKVVSCGFPFVEQSILIVNTTTGEAIEEGIGEIYLSGNSITDGYYQNPELTNATFNIKIPKYSKVSFLRTGDLGFIYNKQLYIKGRNKDVIIIRGKNYYPEDLELVVSKSHLMIKQNATCAFSKEVSSTEALIIITELKQNKISDQLSLEIIKAVKKNIFNHFKLKVHDIILTHSNLPKTTSGKLQRHKIKENYQNQREE